MKNDSSESKKKSSPGVSDEYGSGTLFGSNSSESNEKNKQVTESLQVLPEAQPKQKQFLLSDFLTYRAKQSSSDDKLIHSLNAANTSPAPIKFKMKKNVLLLEGELSKYMERHKTLLKRYLVLNNNALLIYKDNLAYQSFPYKPTIVLPMQAVTNI